MQPSALPETSLLRQRSPRRCYWYVVALLSGIDGFLFLDASFRWHRGLQFAGSGEWWRTAAVVLLVIGGGNALLARVRAPGWLSGPVACVGFVYAYMAASAGSGVYDWINTPFYKFLGPHWFGELYEGWGFVIAFLLGLVYLLVHNLYRRVVGRVWYSAYEGWWRVAGLSLIAVGSTVGAPVLYFYQDPRVRDPAVLETLLQLRLVGFYGALTAGLVLFVRALATTHARWRFLSRVRSGELPAFALREAPAGKLDPTEPIFAKLPLRRPRRVLVRITSDGDDVIGRAP